MPPNAANGDATNGKPNAPLTTSAKATNTIPTPKSSSRNRRCGTITTACVEARERRERHRSKPQPWVVRKLTVALTVGIMGYAGYVEAAAAARAQAHHRSPSPSGRRVCVCGEVCGAVDEGWEEDGAK
ncbi:hypothetical protein C8R45DRAFT_491780 [Mycena sanguinolenta]|nr:hypothetical protein C8R45DRAFT_491780 [Mycena sanguinolenta]